MLTTYSLKMPHAVYGGENAMDNITAILKSSNVRRVAMFTDKGIEGAGLFALPEAAVKASGADYYVLDDLPAEPSYMAVQKLVDQFKASGADMIVACGGGSVMDAAKLASVLVTDEYGVKELLDEPGRAKKCVPIILIPTTAGTGAEVTPNAIVAVPEKELKVGIVNENMIADYVILDARMIKNLPRKIAAATGVDALAHCIECFTGNKANPFSDLYALEGLDLILNNIEKACDDPEVMVNRVQKVCEDVLWDGSWYIRGITAESRKIGTQSDREGKVHMESNTWAVLSGAVDTTRGRLEGIFRRAPLARGRVPHPCDEPPRCGKGRCSPYMEKYLPFLRGCAIL